MSKNNAINRKKYTRRLGDSGKRGKCISVSKELLKGNHDNVGSALSDKDCL